MTSEAPRQYIDLEPLRRFMATPLMQEMRARHAHKGGWKMILFCRVRLALANYGKELTDAAVERIISLRDGWLDKWGEPEAEFALTWLADEAAFAGQVKNYAKLNAIEDVVHRFYRADVREGNGG